MSEQSPPTTVASSPAVSRLKIDRAVGSSGPKRRHWGRWAAIATAIVVIVVIALTPRSIEVQTTTVQTSYPSLQYAQLTASGYVVAQRRAAVASKATGRLIELNVREGSVVKKDEVIARLDASDAQANVLAAQAGVRQAQAGLRVAQAGMLQAQVEQGNAEAELARSQALQARQFVSAQSVDAAQRRVDAAGAAVALAQAAIEQAQASLAQAQAQLKVQRVSEDYTLIRAPFDGVVLVKNANVGDIITPFSSAAGSQGAVVTMADMSTLEVEADVSESNLAKAKTGAPVEITLDALPLQRFRGSVVGIVPTVDRAKATVMVKVRFEQLDERILPEMSAKVTVLSQPATDADQQPVLAVNPQAIVERDGKRVVMRVKATENIVEMVPVTPGRRLGDNVEVGGALKSGEKLVLAPSEKVQQGVKVTVATK